MTARACPWTDDQVATLTKLRAEGYSASYIAKQIGAGCTRNAVIGKANRLQLTSTPQRRKATQYAQGATNRVMARKAPPKPAAPADAHPWRNRKAPKLAPPPAPSIAFGQAYDGPTLLTLARCQCKWPMVGEGADTRFCAAPTDAGPYCAGHQAVSVNPAAAPAEAAIKAGLWAARQ